MRAAAFITQLLAASAAATPSHAKTLLDDRFTGTLVTLPDQAQPRLYPDPSRWAFTFWPGIVYPDSYGDGTNWLAGNAESQAYLTPFLTAIRGEPIPPALRYEPFTIAADGLHIRAATLSPAQQAAYHIGGHQRFGSGMLLSRAAFRFGTVRIVAKLPHARGAWPAFWLLPANHTWPPEIDLLEAMPWGIHQREMHVGYVSARGQGGGAGSWRPLPFDPASDFHAYALDWTPDSLTYRVDDEILARYPTPGGMDGAMNLVINFAVGGTWAYNEMGLLPIDSTDPVRLEHGADAIQRDYPAEMVIRSVTVEAIEAARR